MDQQNIDRLFREKLGDYEITPSASAWSAVEKKIGKKKYSAIYWVAASISLLFVSWIVWPAQEVNNLGIASQEIDHPILRNVGAMDIPVAAQLDVPKKTRVPKQNTDSKASIQLVAQETVLENEKKQELIKLDEIEKTTEVAIEEVDL